MAIRCGIDLGTTYSAISWYDPQNQRVEAVELDHADGEQIIPSVVYFEAGGNVVVGEAALNAALQYPDRVIIGIKRSMGDDFKTQPIDGREYTPQEISAEILKVLKADAELYMGQPVKDVVISVPAHFGDRQRSATQEAAQLAGLDVLEIIPEPHAAALAYAIDNIHEIENRHILVFDLGGGTFDVTLISAETEALESGLTGLKITTLAKEGDRQLGGLDWDRILAHLAAEKAMLQYGIDDPHDDARTEAFLTRTAEKAKRNLSRVNAVSLPVDMQGHMADITRSEFEQATSDRLLNAEALVYTVLEEAEQKYGLLTEKRIRELEAQGTPRADLEQKKIRLLLCGGATRMPMVTDCVTRVMGEPPLHHRNPELLVTMGAAYRAYLAGDPAPSRPGIPSPPEPIVLNRPDGPGIVMIEPGDDVYNPVGVEIVILDEQGQVAERRNAPVIRRNARHGELFEREFAIAFDNMTEVLLKFYEGDSPNIDDCEFLADVYITGLPPNRPAGGLVKVRLWYDSNGIIHGQAIDQATRRDVEIEIRRS
jgi:molecular chaperone DnaK